MASLFEDASLVMIPSGYKDGKVYSIKPTNGDGDLTFTRSNDTATRVGPDGLIEKVRTNLATYSSDFSTVGLTIDATVSTNTTTDPFGTTLADSLLEAATTGNHLWYVDFTVSNGTELTFSIYVKSIGGRNVRVAGSTGTGSELAVVDLANGSILASSGAVSVTSAGSGWYRISVTTTTTGTTARFIVYAADGTSISYAGNTSKGVYLFGHQVEYGVMTDYIATTSAAVSVGPVANLPRLDYLDSSCPKLLLEPQRTNLATDSESFSGYTGTATTIVSNQATSPDGYANADLIYPSASGNFVGKYKTLAPSTTGVVSCFVKQAGKRYAIVGTDNNATYTCIFDLQTATVVYEATNYTGKIEAFANGWYRVSAAYSASTAASYPFIGLADDAAGAVTVDGTNGLYIWGFQYETSASYATSYIPTLSAASTRGADAALKTGISSLIGQTEGTLFVEADLTHSTVGNEYLIQVSVDGDNRFFIYREAGTNKLGCFAQIGAGTIFTNLTAAATTGTIKAAFAYKSGSFAFYVNGVQIAVSSATYTTPASMGIFDLDSNIGSENGFYTYAQSLLFKTRLTNAELAALTTI